MRDGGYQARCVLSFSTYVAFTSNFSCTVLRVKECSCVLCGVVLKTLIVELCFIDNKICKRIYYFYFSLKDTDML